MGRYFAFVLALLFAFTASADVVTIRNKTPPSSSSSCPSGVCINAVTCSSAVSTGWIWVETFDTATFGFALTDADNSVTAVDVTCETALASSVALGSGYNVCGRVSMDADATSTMACPHTWHFANAEADRGRFVVDNLNDRFLNCTFTCTGVPAAADTIHAVVMLRSP